MNTGMFDGSRFWVGCNYWASHAGPRMWREWEPEIVEDDLRRLAQKGFRLLRVFPNWRDFQPLEALAECYHRSAGMRFSGERFLPDAGPGRAGVDSVMLERFRQFARLAEKHGIRLIVSLLTGWMSGRMFVPPAFERRDLMTDPEVVHWEVRFVRTMVRELRDEPAIAAWEPGNECDCLQEASLPELWRWFDAISNAIRREDSTRPILSGANTRCDGTRIFDMAECADVLCAHSYAAFSKHCRVDPVNTMRNAFQAVYMTRCCADLGNTAALIEEVGSFGPTQNGETESARFLENSLWNAWSHDCRALLWWCAFDQTGLDYPPYDECSMERELGLFRADGGAKPALDVLERFSGFAAAHPLPPPRRDAVVLLSRDQDCWSAGFLSFLLAKRAGFDVAFQFADEPLRPAPLYLMPSVGGFRILPRGRYRELLAAVERGASLYVSADDAGIEPFDPFGVPVRTISGRSAPARIVGEACGLDLTIACPHEIRLGRGAAEVLAHDGAGNPAFSCASFGKGKLFFLNVPLETSLAPLPRLFEPGSPPYERIYRILADRAGIRRLVTRDNPAVTLTEHPVSDRRVLVVAVNNSPEAQQVRFETASGWRFTTGAESRIGGNSGALFELETIETRNPAPAEVREEAPAF